MAITTRQQRQQRRNEAPQLISKAQRLVRHTRRIIQDTIAVMNLDPAAEAEVIDALTGAGLLDGSATMTGQGSSIALQLISVKKCSTTGN